MLKVASRRAGKRAFTLIELIVVIVILGILAALAVPNFTSVLSRSSGSVAQRSAENLSKALISAGAFQGTGGNTSVHVLEVANGVATTNPAWQSELGNTVPTLTSNAPSIWGVAGSGAGLIQLNTGAQVSPGTLATEMRIGAADVSTNTGTNMNRVQDLLVIQGGYAVCLTLPTAAGGTATVSSPVKLATMPTAAAMPTAVTGSTLPTNCTTNSNMLTTAP